MAHVVAHQGGWDEGLIVLLVICSFVALLWLANARAGQQVEREPGVDPDGAEG